MKSFARQGLDMLLDEYPEADIERFHASHPWWWSVDLTCGQFAIWMSTGAVYHVRESGAVRDDPFLVPAGSPYGGPVEHG